MRVSARCKVNGGLHDWDEFRATCLRCGITREQQARETDAIYAPPVTPEEMLDNLLGIRDKLKPIEPKENDDSGT